MHEETKYRSEIRTAAMGERTIPIKNLTPILPQRNGNTASVRQSKSCLTYPAGTARATLWHPFDMGPPEVLFPDEKPGNND